MIVVRSVFIAKALLSVTLLFLFFSRIFYACNGEVAFIITFMGLDSLLITLLLPVRVECRGYTDGKRAFY